MEIAIDARSSTLHQGTGIGTYTNNVISNMLSLNSKDNFTLFCSGKFNKNFINDNTNIIYSSGKHSGFYEKYYIPNILKEKKVDLYHIPQNGIGLEYSNSYKKVVTIHDLIPYVMPETVGKGYLERFLRDMPRIIFNSDGILTVSEYSKKDILKFFNGYPEDKIFVTPLAANSKFKILNKKRCKNYLKSKFNINSEFALYIGGFSSRKNVFGLIKAYMEIYKDLKNQCKLVLVGGLKDEGEKLLNFVKNNNLEDNIIFPGYVSDNLLPIFYNACEVFVYPSFYEGFGLPPLEAMSCGAPVISSNISSIPEVTSTDAVLINPYDEDSLKNSLIKVLNNDNLKADLSKRGYNRSLQFTWRQTAKKTLDAYKKILQS
ncbi:glycosyltransferase family 4 protein [Clostridium taeniosporum]|uniref:Glycosyltransferase family 1 protein n=1 Tax=Clostridium taeniosporum TaxID=394958 RepID=A0A1D7XHL6_9CLOT|nr:glycosyltransferase family 1 protein [Clostridium taeniosporum]AOR22569.1 glycosyltransferase family 1 protein [Clostridium taeniosporum]